MDAVQLANSGHPGAPMGLADVGEVLWREVLKHNPNNPHWFNRDRFVLSNGHASMLQYAMLHLSGYAVTIDDIKHFRQLHSKTAGHPEYGECPGVETTTGPLGQGIANGVGFAIAERELARAFNRPGFDVVDHRTWVICGDGCLMEGISHEAASLAGTLGLGKLKLIYDDNGISIDGETKGWFTEDVPARFEAYGWHVIRGVDGHDPAAIIAALADAAEVNDKPTLICCRTVIGFGAPNRQGTAEAHGQALGADEVSLARRTLNWSYAPFEVPEAIYREWDCRPVGRERESKWNALFDAYRAAFPDLAAELDRRIRGELPTHWSEALEQVAAAAQTKPEDLETRKASQRCLNALGPVLPELIGGSADLTGSNNTNWKNSKAVSREDAGNYVNFGVREFAMTAITNGIALHGGFIPYSGTFLIFMEYARNAVRLAALMGAHNVFVYTHDSVGLGEDGPTHEPIEQLANLRTTPNLSVWRPCDTVETAVAWHAAIARRDCPTALVLTRQKTKAQVRSNAAFESVAPRRIRVGRRENRAARDHHRDGLRSCAGGRRGRAAGRRRYWGARRVDAEHRRISRAGRGLSRSGDPERHPRACRGRSRASELLVPLRRPRRRGRRHRPLRPVGSRPAGDGGARNDRRFSRRGGASLYRCCIAALMGGSAR